MYKRFLVDGDWDMEVREMKFLDARIHFDKLNEMVLILLTPIPMRKKKREEYVEGFN